MDWRAKVELFEQIRIEYEFGVGTIQGVARNLRVHRQAVQEAILSAVPAQRKKPERPNMKMAHAAEFIDASLDRNRRKLEITLSALWIAQCGPLSQAAHFMLRQ